MLNTLRKERLPAIILCCLILTALIFPFYTSLATFTYAPDYVLVNLFAVLFILCSLLNRDIDWSRKNIFGYCILLLTAAFAGIWLYINGVLRETPWYTGPLNMVISFLMLFVLVSARPAAAAANAAALPLLLYAVVITNAIGLIPCFFGYVGFSPMKGELGFYDLVWGEPIYSWLYHHKSEYALMLLMSLGLIVTFRRYFAHKWIFFAGVAVMEVGLYISNTRAAMIASLGVFAGLLLDFFAAKKSKRRWLLLLLFIPLIIGVLVLLKMASRYRDILSLGSRTYIWQGGLDYIAQNPYGLWHHCGRTSFTVEGLGDGFNNCHNVFLNWLLQFSIPGGICCVLIFLAVVVMSFVRKPRFLTLGIWGAMLVSMNMDWSLQIAQVTFFFVGVYFLFFCPAPELPEKTAASSQSEQQ